MAEAAAIPEILRRKRSSRNALELSRQPSSLAVRLAPIPMRAQDYPRNIAADALAHDSEQKTALPGIRRYKSGVSVFDRLRWSSAFHAARLSERDLKHLEVQHRADDAKPAGAQLHQTSMASLASSQECSAKKVSPSATRRLPHYRCSSSSETPKLDRKRPGGKSDDEGRVTNWHKQPSPPTTRRKSDDDGRVTNWQKQPSPPTTRRWSMDALLAPRTRHLIAA